MLGYLKSHAGSFVIKRAAIRHNMKITERVFIQWFDEFSSPLLKHCYFRVGNKEKAQDLVQDIFIKAWAHIAGGGDVQNPKAFLYTIAHRLIIDWYRKKKELSLDILQEQGFDPIGDGASGIERHVEFVRVTKLLHRLDDTYRDVLVMSYIEDMSHTDIAQILGETPNAVAVRIHRGLKKLEELARHEP